MNACSQRSYHGDSFICLSFIHVCFLFIQWKIIMKALCCGSKSASQMTYEDIKGDVERNVTKHPSDEQIGLTAHKPMFPPGKIILVVRNHRGRER